jgi:multiple antibiotic resistance protein
MTNLWSFSLMVFMGFFAIMNPLANAPIFISLTEGADAKTKKEISKTATITAFIIVTAFILIGKYIFQIFGLTIPAFKISGGILVFYIGFEMLQSKTSTIHQSEKIEIDEGIATSPLAIPLLAGPGTIVTAMNYVTNANYVNVIITIAIFALMILLTYFAFIYSDYLVKMIGKKHIIVISKIMGIILGIIGVNMLIQGIKLAFKI